LFGGKITYTEIVDMDLSLLQELQSIEELELENKAKAEKRAEAEMVNRGAGKKDLVNKASSVSNSERKR
jgi:hypothetical protein